MNNPVELCNVLESDLAIFYQQQLDPVATEMAAFASRDEERFMEHWHTKLLGNPDTTARTVLYEGHVAGNIACYPLGTEFHIGYWYGREFWGKGIASDALAQLLKIVSHRPLKAYVSESNLASQRVLEKCGFVVTGGDSWYSQRMNREVYHRLLTLV